LGIKGFDVFSQEAYRSVLMRVVFMGSSEFGIPCLLALRKGGHDICAIVSTPPALKGRGLKKSESAVVLFAAQHGLTPVFTPQSLKDDELGKCLASLNADLFIVVAFRILPKKIFGIPPLGTYNLHASLLPKYRGPAPIQRAILAGETETGITIFRIDEGVDTGKIVLQRKIAIGENETAQELSQRLSNLGAESLDDALGRIADGTVVFQDQIQALACPAPKLVKSEGRIDWNRHARSIFNMIRAFKPFPGTYTFFNASRISIEWAVALDGASADCGTGEVCRITSEGFEVQCMGSRLLVLTVKPEGKKDMSASDFVNGWRIGKGTRFS
jgi:methionyl-tRNA formyltransferase